MNKNTEVTQRKWSQWTRLFQPNALLGTFFFEGGKQHRGDSSVSGYEMLSIELTTEIPTHVPVHVQEQPVRIALWIISSQH